MQSKLAELIQRLSSLDDTMGIPNFTLVERDMYDLFANYYGLASILTTHYYVTGKDSRTPILHDVMDQNRWLKQNKSYFSAIAKSFRRLRNCLVHRQFLPMSVIKKFSNDWIVFSSKESQARDLVDLITMKYITLLEVIVHGKKETKVCCPLCGSHLQSFCERRSTSLAPNEPHSISWFKTNGFKDKLKDAEIEILDGKYKDRVVTFKCWEGKLVLVCFNEGELGKINVDRRIRVLGWNEAISLKTKEEVTSLRWLRDNGYKESLKGKEIRIVSGKLEDRIVRFNSWCGTIVFVTELDTGERKRIRLDTEVQIL